MTDLGEIPVFVIVSEVGVHLLHDELPVDEFRPVPHELHLVVNVDHPYTYLSIKQGGGVRCNYYSEVFMMDIHLVLTIDLKMTMTLSIYNKSGSHSQLDVFI